MYADKWDHAQLRARISVTDSYNSSEYLYTVDCLEYVAEHNIQLLS